MPSSARRAIRVAPGFAQGALERAALVGLEREREVARPAGAGLHCRWRARGRSAARSRGPGASAIADSITFSSSRTLPGQSDRTSCSSASSSMPSTRQARSRVLAQEVLDEQRDVLAPLAQRRNLDAHHVQAVEEIRAEAPVRHHRREVAMGRRDHPDVDGHGARPSRPGAPPCAGGRAAAWPARRAGSRRPRPGRACPGSPSGTGPASPARR